MFTINKPLVLFMVIHVREHFAKAREYIIQQAREHLKDFVGQIFMPKIVNIILQTNFSQNFWCRER